YRPDGTLCYRTPAAESPDYSVAEGIKTSLPQLFARGPLVHFFTRCSEGIMEIRGATVHPSADLNRQSAALGYFFVGRVWTDRVAGELSRLIDGRVSLVPPQFDEVRPAFDFQKGKMLFHILLRDEVAHPLAAVRVELSLKAYFVAEQLTQRFLLVICLVVPLFFVLFYLLLARWIHRPVSRIVRALNEGRTDVLEELKNAQDELGDVARLIIRFTIQQKLLSTEVCERRQTEAQLKISQKRFRDIVDNAMEWIWEVDAQGRFTYVSPAMLKALGYDLQEVIGRNLYEFFHPEGLERQKHNMEELFDRHEAFGHLESCCRRKDNTNAWILTSAVPMTAENGRFGGYRGVFTDITQLKVTQQSLTQKLRELEKMNRFMVDRELRMAELKAQLKRLGPDVLSNP
ncbi:MAG: PAS domain S-box protein, partial [Candidatus Omnitrophota bacterium]